MTGDLFDRLQTALGSTYRLEKELGGGGMSRVFVAEETGAGPPGRHQGPATRLRGDALGGPVPPRDPARVPAAASAHRSAADGGRGRRHPVLHHAVRRRRIAPGPAQPEGANRRRRMSSGCWEKSPTRWPTRTGMAWCTATSSRKTSCSAASTRWSRISGSRRRSAASREAERSPPPGYRWAPRRTWRRSRSPPIPTSTIAQTSTPSARWATKC